MPGNVAIAEVDQRQVKRGQMPIWHHLNEEAFAYQVRLHDGRQFTDANSREQRGSKTSVVVHANVRLESNRLGLFSVGVGKVPAINRTQKKANSRCLRRSCGVLGGLQVFKYAELATTWWRYLRSLLATSVESLSAPTLKATSTPSAI